MMIALIILGVLLLFFVFLLSLKMSISIAYEDEVRLWIKVLCFKIRLFPKKKTRGPHSMSRARAHRIRERERKKAEKRRASKEEKKLSKKKKKEEGEEKPPKSVSEILDVLTLVRVLVVEVVRRFLKHLRVKVVRVHVKIATGDAAVTAFAYGTACTALNMILPPLYDVKNFILPDEKDFSVEADFLSETPEIDLELSFSLRVWHVLHIGLCALIKFISHKIKSAQKKDSEQVQKPEMPQFKFGKQ